MKPRAPRYGRIQVRAPGWIFLCAFILLLLAAWNTGANLLYLVLGGVGSFLLISFVFTGWGMGRLHVSREAPDAVHRSEVFGVTLRIENRKFLTSVISLRVERADAPGETAAYVLRVPPRRAVTVRMSASFPRRGVHALPDIILVSGFPFGLFERRRHIHDAVEVVVYPRVISVRAGVLEQLPGSNTVPKLTRGDGDEFFSLRDYIPGDDVRHVAWRISARRGMLLVKEMARQTSRYIVFVIDTYPRRDLADFEDRFEEAIELVASLSVTLLHHQYIVSIMTPTQFLGGGEGTTHVHKVLETLARVMPVEDEAAAGFAWFAPVEETGRASHVFVSPDPRDWGLRAPRIGGKILDPRETIRA